MKILSGVLHNLSITCAVLAVAFIVAGSHAPEAMPPVAPTLIVFFLIAALVSGIASIMVDP
jgi:uncharacterized membrane protein YccC